jgi:phosphoribosylglycinamide formyltransferase 1
MVQRLKLGVLISGRGSNLQALIDACADPAYPAEIVLVLSNKAGAQGLARAKSVGIATAVVSHRDFATREAFDASVAAKLRDAKVDLVCLAGFMRLLTPGFVDAFHDRLINIHPSLLPSFPGVDTHARALAAGVKLHGCTVHFVRNEMDSGPIIVQAAVPVAPGDDEDSLAARVLAAEHKAYPLAVRWIAEHRTHLVAERVVIDGLDGCAPPLLAPNEALQTVVLADQHVRLVPMERSHTDALAEITVASGVARLMTDKLETREAVQRWVAQALDLRAAGTSLPFTVLDAATGAVVGTTRLGNWSPADRRIEIGWTFYAPAAQGTAVNPAAKRLLLTHAFERLGCVRVELRTDARNARSRAAIAKLGAVEEGTLRRHTRLADGSWRDTVYFGITDAEWPQVRARLDERLGHGRRVA